MSSHASEEITVQLRHSYQAGTDSTCAPLILLHGTDGSETDLMSLGADLAPGAARIGIRGTVTTPAGYAFFRRFPDRRIDEADLAARGAPLITFIIESRGKYDLARRPLVVGFSNGAIMSTAMLTADPSLFAGAILFRPLWPFATTPSTNLDGIPVLIIEGLHDTRRFPGDGARVAEQLQALGADVSHHVLPTGHLLTETDEQIARDWIERQGPHRQ